MAGLFDHQAMQRVSPKEESISEWGARAIPGGKDNPGVPIPNLMQNWMRDMDEPLLTSPGSMPTGRSDASYKRRK